jgi:hypothetical protein
MSLESGASVEFVDHWRLRAACREPGPYDVKVKLRAYESRRPNGVLAQGPFKHLRVQSRIVLRRDAVSGRCVLERAPGPTAK